LEATDVTAIVGIRCKDGVVIGADSSATFGDGGGNRFIEQSTRKKIEIIGENIIVAGTGAVGHMQRFSAVTKKWWDSKSFSGKPEIEIGKMSASAGIADFHQTHAMNNLEFAAMVAYPANDQPSLCELPGGRGLFQPEIKKVDDLWFASTGSGQSNGTLATRIKARGTSLRWLQAPQRVPLWLTWPHGKRKTRKGFSDLKPRFARSRIWRRWSRI